MRTFILLIMAALAGMTCRAQERKPEGGVRILTAGQHITPYRIGHISSGVTAEVND